MWGHFELSWMQPQNKASVAELVLYCLFMAPVKRQTAQKRGLQERCIFQMGAGKLIMTTLTFNILQDHMLLPKVYRQMA